MSEENENETTGVAELAKVDPVPGFNLSETAALAEAFYNDFDPDEHDADTMMAAHEWASHLVRVGKQLKSLSGALFIRWMEHRGRTCPVLDAKKDTPKGEERKQKLDDNGKPMTKFWPAEVVFQDTRYSCAYTSKTEAKLTPGKMLELLFDKAGGDFDMVASCLSSGAFKQGEVRNAYGFDVWDECFEKVTEPELKDGAPRKRTVTEVSTFFVDQAMRRREALDAERESNS